jgi:hypothetical protein
VVNRPGGRGLHIWIDTDTSRPQECRPRWNPDAARLVEGNGPTPRSTGRAPREEFFAAMGHGPVRLALQQQVTALCRSLAPERRFVWIEPPRSAQAWTPPAYPLLEEEHLLSDPKAVRRAEKRLLGLPLLPEDFEEMEEEPEVPGP